MPLIVFDRPIRWLEKVRVGKAKMDTHGLIVWLVVGAVAGWLAGTLMKGGGFGLIGDIIVGIIGAFIGGWLAGVLHISIGGGLISSIITATAGAIVLILIIRMVKRA
jgi:uncharacterized membrane protein YeaQ/YmgE (transglycosylase-associated protein family)